ncbi:MULTISPECIES: DUF3616 domain-containing protein [unclassified Bradyrhizobium]|uniref:DUF3616 domain-containing protein n=1 Tax=Bradyrhizobium sp. USDA 4541 TaxID=2817704 RepID=UPI0020A5D52B|nr:DUF3616 domain-containing protein [Bradyrhizobium sp. USDA 4541]MCP1850265.1 hypothetical protein [Bradyrhizobium sp. USDA 4541]
MRSSLVVTLVLALTVLAELADAEPATLYRGMCDASAAVALDKDHFVVADDELNVMRIYKRDQPDSVAQVDLSSFLDTEPDKESDLEGAAAIGNRIFWISSHGTNKDGKVQDRRRRLFASELVTATVPTVRAVGKPYSKLVEDLAADPRFAKYGLAEAATKPPKTKGALNIEGLAATADGRLLVGFRNPLPGDNALVVSIDNPDEVITGAPTKLGEPIEIKLGGRGIRSFERIGTSYLIVAGPIDGKGSFDLYRWSGKSADDPAIVPNVDLSGLNPEALFAIPNTEEVQILSDDGTVEVDGTECKDAQRKSQQFRSLTVKP